MMLPLQLTVISWWCSLQICSMVVFLFKSKYAYLLSSLAYLFFFSKISFKKSYQNKNQHQRSSNSSQFISFHDNMVRPQEPITPRWTDRPIAYLMKPVSEVITSPGTTRSFRSEAESNKETAFRIVGNLMSAAMLLLLQLLLLLLFLAVDKRRYVLYRRLLIMSLTVCF